MGGKAAVIRPLAAFLRSYQLNGGYTPGPLYLAATVLGLAGTLSLVRRKVRHRPTRDLALACCLFFTTAAAILLASDIPEFSWRYQLPAIDDAAAGRGARARRDPGPALGAERAARRRRSTRPGRAHPGPAWPPGSA